MASLMENLITILEEEGNAYEELLELSTRKTPVIVQGDLEGLEKITDEEQVVVSKINRLDALRQEVTKDIANVMNKDVNDLKLAHIIDMLEQRPQEQKMLAAAHDKLKTVTGQMKSINDQNRELIRHSLEMVEFDLNLLQSLKAAPQTANYDRGAVNQGASIGAGRGGFDAKQ